MNVKGLTLAGHQVPMKLLYHSPSSTRQGKENMMKGSWVEKRTGREQSPVTIMDKTDSAGENELKLLPVKIRAG